MKTWKDVVINSVVIICTTIILITALFGLREVCHAHNKATIQKLKVEEVKMRLILSVKNDQTRRINGSNP